MKHEQNAQFKPSEKEVLAPNMMQAIRAAKSVVTEMTGQTIDSVAQCHKDADGSWTITIDTIESLARMGDNDLLATYDVSIGPNESLMSYSRRRRYHREDRES